MIRSIALSLFMVAGLAASAPPASAQGGTCSSDSPFCNSRPGGIPGSSADQRRPGVPQDPGYYRPDPRPRPPSYRPPHRPPTGYYGPPPGYYRPPPPAYYPIGISCSDARRIVRNEGFHRVRAIDCEGRRYQFRASYRGRPVIVIVSSRSGRIIDVERI